MKATTAVSPEQIERDRNRLLAKDPIAMLIDNFVNGDTDELVIECPEPGTVIGDARFVDTPDATPDKMYSRFYTIALRGHWLKRDVWVRKCGRTVHLTKYDPKGTK